MHPKCWGAKPAHGAEIILYTGPSGVTAQGHLGTVSGFMLLGAGRDISVSQNLPWGIQCNPVRDKGWGKAAASSSDLVLLCWLSSGRSSQSQSTCRLVSQRGTWGAAMKCRVPGQGRRSCFPASILLSRACSLLC